MSVQRKLNALLFELQTAQSPLAQAKILARSWRTLRELSATDRRLLARHAGFDGAEQILEGLAKKSAGFAPATLLSVLNRARATDGAEVNALLNAIRDPSRRDEAITRGAGLARGLLVEDDDEDGPQEIVEALDQLQSVEEVVRETPEEALAALTSLEKETARPEQPPEARPRGSEGVRLAEGVDTRDGATPGPRPAAPRKPAPTPPKAEISVVRPTPRRTAPMAGWEHLGERRHNVEIESKPAGRPEPTKPDTAPSGIDASAVFGALGAGASSFSRLRVLERDMKRIRGSSLATLRGLLDTFPGGWARRRALAAMIAAGVPSRAAYAIDLIADLESEIDRRWCLGALAQRGDLRGSHLQRSLELVASPAARRRIENIAART